MIDTTREVVLPISEAAKTIPRRRRGKACCSSTLYRWAKNGLNGVHLETIIVGGTTCTSREALQRFFVQLSLKKHKPTPASSRETRERRADAALRKRGF